MWHRHRWQHLQMVERWEVRDGWPVALMILIKRCERCGKEVRA